MVMELTVTTTPAVIDANFDVLKESLTKELEDYDFVVTEDTVKDSKKRATEINKLKSTINTRRKEAVDLASAPINHFKDRAKELTDMCEQARQKILDQVEVFESKQIDKAKELLEQLKAELYQRHQIREEFQTADVSGLAKLTALTSKGKLTKATTETVAAKISECQLVQQRTDLRLSQLENECHRAGLHSPLSREHVEGFLFSDDARYTDALNAVIERELERQAATAKKLEQQQAEEQQKQEAPQEPVEKSSTETAPVTAEYATTSQQPFTDNEAIEPGKQTLQIHCTFELTVPAELTDEALTSSLRQKLQAAGIRDSIKHISVQRPEQGKEAA